MQFEIASEIFDQYINWPVRLSREIPYLLSRIEKLPGKQVIDVACGSGAHAAALAKTGLEMTVSDPIESLLVKAKSLAAEARVVIEPVQASFEELPEALPADSYNGVLCLGNSISLVKPGEDLDAAFRGLAHLLAPGGLMVVHTLNYPMLRARGGDIWGPVRIADDGRLILKGFLPRPAGAWDTLFIALGPKEGGSWTRQAFRFEIHPHTREEILRAAARQNLALNALFGGFQEEPFDHPKSADLVYELTKRADR